MIRSGAHRALSRPLASLSRQQARLTSMPINRPSNGRISQFQRAAVAVYQPKLSMVRHASSKAVPGTYRDPELEASYRKRSITAEPEGVTSTSSLPTFAESQGQENEVDMMAGIRHDVKVIRDTFALDKVPREALNVGLAGVVPYLATSAATVFCALEINTAIATGSGFLLSEAAAEALLQALEPIQVGYGAVILSCLGTIHWGLEWAKYGGTGGYRRYLIGVATPALAWPTIFLPVESALIMQFLAFNLLYAVDNWAAKEGWTPAWYGSYRFILTFVVGASIVITLIGRGQIQDRIGKMPSARDRFNEVQHLVKAGIFSESEKEAAEEEEAEE